MYNDLDSSLQNIQGGQKSLARRLTEFDENNLLINHEKSAEFFDRLRCFIPVDSNRKQKSGKISMVARKKVLRELHPESHFIAVSYPWGAGKGEDNSKGGYIMRPSNKVVKVRNVVLDRTISFMKYMQGKQEAGKILPLWIDQLSIDQVNKTEKKIAMQSMDLLYKHCTYAVGYIWTQLRTRHQENLLVSLLRGEIVSDNRGSPTLAKNVDPETAYDTFRLIRLIVGDSWWERAWIFQEDYLAGLKMWLLIRCRDSIRFPNIEDTLYSLPGEIIIKSVKFKKHASLFCLAYLDKTSEPNIRLECEKILSKAGKYNILDIHDEGKVKERTLSLYILENLKERTIRNRSDLPAIIGNACDYNIRIDTASRRSRRRSLSLALLAQYVGNGELINNKEAHPGDTSKSAFEFLQQQSLRIDAPFSAGALTFKKHCRLCVLGLSRTGIHSEGMLWKLSNRDVWQSGFRMDTDLEYGAADTALKDQNRLLEYHRYHLNRFVSFLMSRGYQTPAQDVKRYLLEDENSTPFKREEYDEWRYKTIMAIYIVNAMISVEEQTS